MSDQDDINLEGGDVGTTETGGRKISGLIPQLLKWVAIVLAALIFIVTVVVITVNIIGGSGKNMTTVPVSEEYTGVREILQWYREPIGVIQTRTSDEIPPRLSRRLRLAILQTINHPGGTQCPYSQLKDSSAHISRARRPMELKNEDKIKIEIRNQINDNILSKSWIKDVRFTKYEIVEQ